MSKRLWSRKAVFVDVTRVLSAFCASAAGRDLGKFEVILWKRGYFVFVPRFGEPHYYKYHMRMILSENKVNHCYRSRFAGSFKMDTYPHSQAKLNGFMVPVGLWILSSLKLIAFVVLHLYVCVFCAFLFVPLFFLSESLQFSSATLLWWKSSWLHPLCDYFLCVWAMLRMFTFTQVRIIVRVSCRIRCVSGIKLVHSAADIYTPGNTVD